MRPTRPELDSLLTDLANRRRAWAQTPNAERITILADIKDRLMDVAPQWAAAAARHKQIPKGSPLEGEEWISGPYTVMAACNALMATLSDMQGKRFLVGLPVRKVNDAQIAVKVLPHSIWDRLLLSGIEAEIWMEPGISADTLGMHTATRYDIPPEQREGSISLVLGAGNIAAIAPLDCFHKLFVEHSVVMLKLNPVNDYLAEFLSQALEPLIRQGYLQVVRGDVEVGEYLCNHPLVESIHITGAEASYNAIVWGAGDSGARRRAINERLNDRLVTAELGAVCPTIVVPGEWTKADIRFQAEQVATQKLHNSGFNCVACQVLLLPRGWKQRDEFLDTLKVIIEKSPPRGLYYPGANDRIDRFCEQFPNAEVFHVPDCSQRRAVVTLESSEPREYAEQTEVFAPVLAVVDLEGTDACTYLDKAINYCNDRLHGTLGANIIIDPKARKLLAKRWDELLDKLHYGCIAINAWTGLGFLSVQTPWGAFPGHTPDDIQSGTGFVHNTWMFDNVERCVIEAPFRPFPRNLRHGSMTLLPRPPWFVTNRRAHRLGALLTDFQHKPGWLKIPRIFANALAG